MFAPEIPAPSPHDVLTFNEKAVRERREAMYPGLRGLNKKYCMGVSDPDRFDKCAKLVSEDNKALERIKEQEKLKKSGDDHFDPGLLKALKDSRKDYKASLIRFSEANG
jgi:hypothetical protein